MGMSSFVRLLLSHVIRVILDSLGKEKLVTVTWKPSMGILAAAFITKVSD